MENSPVFLTSLWANLSFLTFQARPEALLPHLPRNLEFDCFNGNPIMSLVAFQFIGTRFAGIKVPFYHTFTELNLRFYVKDKTSGEKGVVFIKEICPYYPVAITAKLLFNEKFSVATCSMKEKDKVYAYRFGSENEPGHISLSIKTEQTEALPVPGSIEHFTVDRYTGYSKWHTGRTLRYYVEHPEWKVRKGSLMELKGNLKYVYGKELAEILSKKADCYVFSEGSHVKLTFGKLMKDMQ